MSKSKILYDILNECHNIKDNHVEYDEKILQLPSFSSKEFSNMLEWNNDLADELRKTNKHWGQLKLFLSEIIHLVNFVDDYDSIVYAGAAPGIHIVMLADLFPNKKFYLFDPNPVWDIRLHEKKNVSVYTRYFNDTIAHRFFRSNSKYFLISDIRNLDIGKAKKCGDKRYQDNIVENDMHIQFGFWHQLQPEIALFKFRLTREEGSSKFPAGNVYLPIYGKHDTAESRMLIKGYDEFKMIKYDNKSYRQRMFYYHVKERNDTVLAATIICKVSKMLGISFEYLIKKIKPSLQYHKY